MKGNQIIGLLIGALSIGFYYHGSIASDAVPAKPQDHPIALVDVTIHSMTGPVIAKGTVLFDRGKIVAVGEAVSIPAGTEKIQFANKHVYPGLIDACTCIGLVEIGAVSATVDTAETGSINPNVRAEVAINPESEIIPVTRANGVTCALTVPRGGLISGTSALIMLDGWTWEDMLLKAPVGLHLIWPSMTIRRVPGIKLSEEEQRRKRDRQIKELREAFSQAKSYRIAREAQLPSGGTNLPIDLRWEAMIPVLQRKIPVFIYADEARQINAVVTWAEQENVKLVVAGGQDSWRVADLLREKNIPVILMPILRTPMRDWEGYDTPFSAAARLSQKGVRFCIAGDGGASNERNLPYHAAMAAGFGLAKEEALKAITLYPAQILGVADRIGSLEPGKDATFIVTDGDPLEIVTRVERVFIQGKDVDLRNKHTMLYDKYTEKYRRLSKP